MTTHLEGGQRRRERERKVATEEEKTKITVERHAPLHTKCERKERKRNRGNSTGR